MRRVIPMLLYASVGAVGIAAVAGCDSSDEAELPDDAVAMVGDTVITKADFRQRVRIAVFDRAHADEDPLRYDPPAYTACVAGKQASAKQKPDRQQDEEAPTEARLKKECEDEYSQLQDDALGSVIRAEWVRQESAKRGIELSAKAVERAAKAAKAESFPRDKAYPYREYLNETGMTEADYLSRIRVNELADRLERKLEQEAADISRQDIASFYRENKKRFVVQERRGVRFVPAKTRAEAEKAKAALEGRENWQSVVKQYSAEPFFTRLRGRPLPIEKGKQGEALNGAIFGASMGEIGGPVKEEEFWVVFEVVSSKPPYQRSLEQSSEEIRTTLRSNRDERAGQEYVNGYRDQTTCAPGYEVPDCRNGPEEST